jgi:sugar lactone lactonase YvrE
MHEPQLLLGGLMFPEAPRWHDGRLWFSDQHACRVIAVDAKGRSETIFEVPGHPSGLGWLPDGTLLVVSMNDRKLLRWKGGALAEAADLSAIAGFHCNDMVVDSSGRAYVGNFGFDMFGGAAPAGTSLALVTPDGKARAEGSDLMFPNGLVITPDGKTLIVGESYGGRLTAFDIAADGSLSNRRVWAQIDAPPDGCCLDAENCIWVAIPSIPGAFLRVAEGGEIKQRIDVPDAGAFACMLGGDDGKTLFLIESREMRPDKVAPGDGRIRTLRVDVPHAGRP